MITKINFESGAGYEMHRHEIEFLNRFAASINDNVETAIIREQWVDSREYNKLISNLPYTVRRLIKVSMLDEIKPTSHRQDFNEIFYIGHYPGSKYYINFIAYMFYKKIKPIEYNKKSINIAYMCLNGKPHYHRYQLFESIKKNNLINKGLISFNTHKDEMPYADKVYSLSLDNDTNQKNIIPTDYNAFDFGKLEYWHRHFLNIVTETLPDPDSKYYFLTEKTYKPIYGYKPFLIYAPNGAKKSLNYIGIEEYNNEFKDITDLDLYNIENYVPFLKVLSTQSVKYLRKKYNNLLPKILHNRQQFLNFVKLQEFKYNNMIYEEKHDKN
jgi:hypothetical protein